jgi:hypothetical protein
MTNAETNDKATRVAEQAAHVAPAKGFVSLLGSKGSEKVESSKNTGRERGYRTVK